MGRKQRLSAPSFVCFIIFVFFYVNVCRKKDTLILAILNFIRIFAGRNNIILLNLINY